MDMDFEKALSLLNGETNETFLQRQLSDADCTQIENAIDTIFSGLSLEKWLDGDTLTQAWAKSLDKIRDLVFSIPDTNSATHYARNYVFVHRRKWHVKIVSCHRPNELINCPPEKRNSWTDDAKMKIQVGTELLYEKLKNFSCTTPRFTNQFNQQSKEIIKQHIKTELSREREHEHIREK